MSATFNRLLKVTAYTKRAPAIASGKRGAAVPYLVSVLVTPLDPVDETIQRRYSTNAAIDLRQCFTRPGVDIQAGDLLVVGSVEYAIRSVGSWVWMDESYLHLIVEEQRTP